MMLKKALNSKLIVLLFLLGLFSPDYLKILSVPDIVLSVLKMAASVIILLIFFVDIRKYLKKKFNILLIALTIELLFSTLISEEASIYYWLIKMVTVVLICFFFEELMTIAPYNGLRCLYWYFSLITMINTVTVFLYPHAMYPNDRGIWVCWFLGEDNGAYYYYILTSTFAMLYCSYITKRITLLALLDWAGAFIFVFHNDIATGIACQVVWLLLIAGYQFRLFRKLLKAQYALYIMLAGVLFLVLLRMFILEPVVEALGRNITLTGRTITWDRTIAVILKRPLFGYGVCDGDTFAGMIRRNGITMAHDWLLDLGFMGGIVAVILYIIQLVFAFREEKAFQMTTYYRCVVIGMIIVFIRAVTEGSNREGYFMLPAMICYSKEFLEGINSDVTSKKRTIRFRFGRFVRRPRQL